MLFASTFKLNSSKKAGLAPGTMVYIGSERQHQVHLTGFHYNEKDCQDLQHETVGELQMPAEGTAVSWINITGIHDLDLIQAVGEKFKLHPLILEDLVNATHRPKVEVYENGLFLVLKMISWDASREEPDFEQVSLFLGKGYVLSFQEKPADILGPIRDRLINNQGRLRKKKEDYLFYTLIDVITSHYFVVLAQLEDHIDRIEEKLTGSPDSNLIHEIQKQKRTIIYLRKAILPLREVIHSLTKTEVPEYFDKKTLVFLADLQDQLNRITELIETYREIMANLFDLHFALNGHKMNEIMKVLTIVASIFIPLTFLAGIYGMNFEYIPELSWRYSYFVVWGLMVTLGLGMLYYFRRKRWL